MPRRRDEDDRSDDDEDDRRNERRNRRPKEDDEFDRDRRDYSDDFHDRGRNVPYPSMLTTAGYIWLAFGVLILVNAALTIAIVDENKKVGPVSSGCTATFIALFGIVFLHVGRQSINGTATGTIGNGSGSIVFGLLGGIAAIPYFQIGEPLLGAIQVASGLGLVAAGIMAITVSSDYADWRQAQRRESKDRDRNRGRGRDRDRDD